MSDSKRAVGSGVDDLVEVSEDAVVELMLSRSVSLGRSELSALQELVEWQGAALSRLGDQVRVLRERVATLLPGPSSPCWVCDTYCTASGRLLRRLQVADGEAARLWLERSDSAAGSLPGAAVTHCAHEVFGHGLLPWDDAIGGDASRASQL